MSFFHSMDGLANLNWMPSQKPRRTRCLDGTLTTSVELESIYLWKKGKHLPETSFFFNRRSADVLNRILFFGEFCWEPCQHTTRGRDIVRDDVYTRKRFSESEGTRFGGPGQKALPSMNEWIFA